MSSVSVDPSPIEGKGVFTTRPIQPGETVLVLDTSRVVAEEHPLKPEEDEQETSFFELPASLQLEYLPMLVAWFIEEHREEIERLKERLGEGEWR